MTSNKIIQSYQNGHLNEYMYNKLLKAIEKGANDNLIDELVQDAKDASETGVNSDKDYTTYFFIRNFIDDLLEDTFGLKLDDLNRKDLIHHVFSYRDDNKYKLNNLVDFRILVYDWLCNRMNKKAYPNIAGKVDKSPVYNIDKWITTLKNIYAIMRNGQKTRSDAIDVFTKNWDSDERQHFVNWLKYYESKNMEKYNVKNAKLTKEADLSGFVVPQSFAREPNRTEQNTVPYLSNYKIDKEKTKREKELEHAKIIKMKMRGRLLSFKRLLDKYNDILPKQNLDNIYIEINNLDRNISKLDVYASIQDCMLRSANRIRKFGFQEGAKILEKMAEEDYATDKEVIKSLPQGISDQPNLPRGIPAINIKTIIDRLEGLSKTLKSRDMIRELASIDILLNELGLASYFPELTDAQSKLIEAYGYASNKVESIIAKLRGSGTSRLKAPEIKSPTVTTSPKVVPPAKPINTGEIMGKPIGEVKKELPKEAPKKTE